MSPKPLHPASRALSLLFALGVLGVLAGLTGLAVTAMPKAGDAPDPAPGRSALHPARLGGKYGYADAAGKMVIPARFDMADTFSEGLALVRDRGRFGYIDGRGAFAIPAAFQHALPFHDGFAAVRNGQEWMFLDRAGHPVAGHAEDSAPLASRGEDSR